MNYTLFMIMPPIVLKITVSDASKMSKKEFNEAMVELENTVPEQKNINKIETREIKELQIDAIKEKFDPPFHNQIDDGHLHTITYFNLCCIASVQHGILVEEFNEIPIFVMDVAINAISSTATTKEEMALGTFTRRKLKKLPNWSEWKEAKNRQVDRFVKLKMYGEPQERPKEEHILLYPHWQYQIKRSGVRQSRACCDSSKQSAPLLH